MTMRGFLSTAMLLTIVAVSAAALPVRELGKFRLLTAMFRC